MPLVLAALAVAACSGAEPASSTAQSAPPPSPAAGQSAQPAPPSEPVPTSPVVTPSPSSNDPFASTLTVFAIHAPTSTLNPDGLMWTSPGGLTRQVLLNEAGAVALGFTHTIGHATVRVDCAATAGRAAARFAGAMTNADDAEFRTLVLDKGVGLGVMFEGVKGRLQTEAELSADEAIGKANGGMNFVRFGIAADVCHRLLDYAAEYQKLGIDKTYGLAVRPLHKEGAGCSAFVVSFLELANLLEPRFRAAWAFKVRVPKFTEPWIGVPEPIVGGSMNPGVTVPVTRVASLTRGWATPQEEGFDSEGWDPTQMNVSIDAIIDAALKSGAEKVEQQGKLRGLLLDRTQVPATPALMSGAFWK